MLEFSFLLMPFLIIVFAIGEVVFTYATQQMLTSAIMEVARDIKVGRLTAENLDKNAVVQRVCARLGALVKADCSQIEVDIRSYPSFSQVPTIAPLTADGDVNTAGFGINPGGGDSINQIRAFYRREVFTDIVSQRISTLKGNKVLIYSTDVWRSE